MLIGHKWNISYWPVWVGLLLSVSLVLGVYYMVVDHALQGPWLVTAAACLGVVQAIIQFVFFMHIGIESKPRWNLMIFIFTILIVFIIVGGSLWIMSNLRYNMSIIEQKASY